jgi:hypothetical protein
MIARAGSGWQTVLADLSLILFMVTASAVNEAPSVPPPAPVVLPALGEPVALWRAGPDAPTLPEWVAQHPDPRLGLTILAPPEEAEAALALGAAAGRPTRLVLEPGLSGLSAALGYDRALAQGLHSGAAKENQP